MNDFYPIHGRAYANDPDFDAFRGRVVGEYTVKREDRRRNCTIWTTYQVIDLGRSAALDAHDPDAVGAYEGPGAIGVQGYVHHKTRALLEQIRALLRVRPMLCHEIAAATGNITTRIQKLFINQPAGFRVVGRGLRGNLWGLEK